MTKINGDVYLDACRWYELGKVVSDKVAKKYGIDSQIINFDEIEKEISELNVKAEQITIDLFGTEHNFYGFTDEAAGAKKYFEMKKESMYLEYSQTKIMELYKLLLNGNLQ
ncbi:hypothetical protein [Brevibacillus brevis]|uniref:hypothetical protein n=1 Tax=Brevibacillus brevis TaxID=1393 RepID=UPI0007D8B0E0|nr:hypothetical protein [Brevibacillus brevis]